MHVDGPYYKTGIQNFYDRAGNLIRQERTHDGKTVVVYFPKKDEK